MHGVFRGVFTYVPDNSWHWEPFEVPMGTHYAHSARDSNKDDHLGTDLSACWHLLRELEPEPHKSGKSNRTAPPGKSGTYRCIQHSN